MSAIPGTSARRGKRRKLIFGCRLCKREWRAEYRSKRDGLRTAPGRLRFFCNGKIET